MPLHIEQFFSAMADVRWKVRSLDVIPLALCQSKKEDVLEFPHVSRPVVVLQHGNGLGRKLDLFAQELFGVIDQKMVGQKTNFAPPFTQRGHIYWYYTESLIKILSEFSRDNFSF